MADLILAIELVQAPADSFFLTFHDVHEVLSLKLGLKPQDLEGLQPSHRRYDVAVKSLVTWKAKNIEIYLNRRFNLGSGKIVEISRSYEATTTIRVVRMPMFWDEEKIKRIFSWYGDVKKVEKEQWRSGMSSDADSGQYMGIWNGNYRLRMVLKQPIPNTITVSQAKFEVYYQGQERTCWKCGEVSHSKKDCKIPWTDYSNRFDMDDFPELSPDNAEPAEGEGEEVQEDMEDDQQEQTSAEDGNKNDANEEVENEQVNANKEAKQVNADETVTKEQVNASEMVNVINEETTETDQDMAGMDDIIQESEETTDKTSEKPPSKITEGASLEGDSNSQAISDRAQEMIAKEMKSKDVNVKSAASPSGGQKESETVKVMVHHEEGSQVTKEVKPTKSHLESTASASEGEMEDEDLQLGSLREEISKGFWTLVGGKGKRKAKQSSDEESDSNIKIGVGSFVNSFLSSSTQRSKKKKEDEDSQTSRNKKKDEEEGHSDLKASSSKM